MEFAENIDILVDPTAPPAAKAAAYDNARVHIDVILQRLQGLALGEIEMSATQVAAASLLVSLFDSIHVDEVAQIH